MKCQLDKLKSGFMCLKPAKHSVEVTGENPESGKKITRHAELCGKHFNLLKIESFSGEFTYKELNDGPNLQS